MGIIIYLGVSQSFVDVLAEFGEKYVVPDFKIL